MELLICWLHKQSPAYKYAIWCKRILLLDKSPPNNTYHSIKPFMLQD